MKILITIIAILIANKVYSQAARIGFKLCDIQKEYKSSEFTQELDYTSEGVKTLIIEGEIQDAVYFFDADNVCITCAVIPLFQGRLHSMIEECNNKYVILSATSWRWYGEGNVVLIEVKTFDNGKMYLIYTLIY